LEQKDVLKFKRKNQKRIPLPYWGGGKGTKNMDCDLKKLWIKGRGDGVDSSGEAAGGESQFSEQKKGTKMIQGF